VRSAAQEQKDAVKNEASRVAVMQAIDDWSDSKKIKELSESANLALVIRHVGDSDTIASFVYYLWLLVSRDFCVRLSTRHLSQDVNQQRSNR